MSALEDLVPLTQAAPSWFRDAFNVPRQEGYVDVDGCQIHYFAWGDESKPGVVLAHGMMAHARCWAFIAPLLADRYHLVALDLSGMGDSDARDVYDMVDRAKELKAVAVANNMYQQGRKPTLVCHSFGGSVGITAVGQEPDAWAGIIVCDSTMLLPEQADEFMQRMPKRPDKVRPARIYADLDSALSRFRLAPEQPCANTYLFEYMAHHSLRAVEGGWRWKFSPSIMVSQPSRNLEWWLSLAPKFAALDIPKAYVYGALSSAYTPLFGHYLDEQSPRPIPQVPIPDAYHHIMLDQPLALAATLDGLLQTFA